MKNRIFIFLAAAVAVGFLAQSAPVIQSSMAKGTIHGVVTDPSGAVIPGAKVKVSAGELIQTVATGETGQYAISGLPPGH